MNNPDFRLRAYRPSDEEPAIELWRRTWQAHYPHLDFASRLDWWRERWRTELVPAATIAVVETSGGIAGFMTVDPDSGYLDQIVVAPEHWGSNAAAILVSEAKRISPGGIELMVNKDNARAIAFYAKHGFSCIGEGTNPVSGRPVDRMRWRPQAAG